MNFFQKKRNIVGFRSHSGVLASSAGNLSIFEKLFFSEQMQEGEKVGLGVFELKKRDTDHLSSYHTR